MLPHLAWAMQERGSHSWGASDGFETVRYLGPICCTWELEGERVAGWEAGIFHTRAASVGPHDTVDNAHPFSALRADGTEIIGIHNGTLSNWQELNRTYGRDFAVDSQHLWKHRADRVSWETIRGVANLAWWEVSPHRTRTLLAARINSTSLSIGRTEDGGLVFCSTKSDLLKAALFAGTNIDPWYDVGEGVVYRLGTDGVLYDTTERVTFGTYVSPSTGGYVRPPVGSGRHGAGFVPYTSGAGRELREEGICYKCNSAVSSAHYVLCSNCLSKSVTEFLALSTAQRETA